MITAIVTERSISDALRNRRKALGLSLSEAARRAGTSAPAFSRYENGWSRFGVHTLRKLAAALECELQIRLRPEAARAPSGRSPGAVARRIQRLFWDAPLGPADLREHPVWVVERVLEYGQLEDIRALSRFLGRKHFLRTVAEARRVSPRTRNFWRLILDMEGVPCTKRFSRNTAWNS